MTINDQITLVVTWLDALELMSDEDYANNEYWGTTVMVSAGSQWIQAFLDEIGIINPDRYTAIAILKNFRLYQCIFGFTENI